MSSAVPTESQPLNSSHTPPRSYNSLPNSSEDPQPLLTNVSHVDFLWIVSGLWSAIFLTGCDGTVVATLVSPIGSYFERAEQSSYLGTSYLLSVCSFTSLYGRLSDILGRKGAMLLALALFGSGTVACGLAPSMETLILARFIAGMGGGGIMTVTSVAISDLVPLKQRGVYQGAGAVVYGLGASLGGPIGGWMNDTWGWRTAFLLQTPLLVASFALISLKVNMKLPDAVANESMHSRLGRIDLLGSLTLVFSIGSILSAFSIKMTEELPWSHPLVWGLLTFGCIVGLAFIWVETRWARYPILPLRIISQRTPLAVALANFLAFMITFSMLYNVPLYFSAVKLSSATEAGLHLLPNSVAMPIGSMFVGWWIRRTGKYYNITMCTAAVFTLANVLMASWNYKTSALNLWLDIVPHGFGFSGLVNGTLIAIIASVSKEDISVATGISYLFRTTGQVLGVSLSGILLQGILLDQLRKRITGPGSSDIIEGIRHSISSIAELAPPLRNAAVESYATALRAVFISQVGMSVLLLVACTFIEERHLS